MADLLKDRDGNILVIEPDAVNPDWPKRTKDTLAELTKRAADKGDDDAKPTAEDGE